MCVLVHLHIQYELHKHDNFSIFSQRLLSRTPWPYPNACRQRVCSVFTGKHIFVWPRLYIQCHTSGMFFFSTIVWWFIHTYILTESQNCFWIWQEIGLVSLGASDEDIERLSTVSQKVTYLRLYINAFHKISWLKPWFYWPLVAVWLIDPNKLV